MKQSLATLALCLLFAAMPAMAQTPEATVTLDSLHKQLIESIENEIASNKELDASYAEILKRMVPVWQDKPSSVSIESRLRSLQATMSRGNVTPKTKESVDSCIKQMNELIQKEATQLVQEVAKVSGDLLRRVIKTNDPEEIRKCIAEYKEFRAKVAHSGSREEGLSSYSLSAVSQFMDNCLSFHNYRVAENFSYAAGQIRSLEEIAPRLSSIVPTAEINVSLENMRKSIGMLAPNDLEALWKQTLDELLDDANQDRIDEIMQQVKKHIQISQSSSSGSANAQRWQRLDIFGRQLQESIARGKDGGVASFRAEEFTRNDSSYGRLMKPEELLPRLQKYVIRSKAADGSVTEVRLYYDVTELRAACDQMLAEVLDDANQSRLDELQDKIRNLRAHASASRSSDTSTLSARMDKLLQLSRSISQSVKSLQNGGNAPIVPSQMMSDYGDNVTLLSSEEFLQKLKKYLVKVPVAGGDPVLRALYVDANDVLQRINSFTELPQAMPDLSRAMANASRDGDQISATRWLPNAIRYAELANLLKSGETFSLSYASQPNPFYEYNSRSLPFTGAMPEKLTQLEAEAEWAVIKRFFPQESYGKAEEHEPTVKKLMDRFRADKNYQAVNQLQMISFYFKPARNLLSPAQGQSVRDYLDGVRQEEVYDQPRLAVYHFQKVALSQTSVVDAAALKERLQKLKKQYPSDYDKGIDDALRAITTPPTPRELEVPAAAK